MMFEAENRDTLVVNEVGVVLCGSASSCPWLHGLSSFSDCGGRRRLCVHLLRFTHTVHLTANECGVLGPKQNRRCVPSSRRLPPWTHARKIPRLFATTTSQTTGIILGNISLSLLQSCGCYGYLDFGSQVLSTVLRKLVQCNTRENIPVSGH